MIGGHRAHDPPMGHQYGTNSGGGSELKRIQTLASIIGVCLEDDAAGCFNTRAEVNWQTGRTRVRTRQGSQGRLPAGALAPAPSEPLCGVRHKGVAERVSAQSIFFVNKSICLMGNGKNTHICTHILIGLGLHFCPPNRSCRLPFRLVSDRVKWGMDRVVRECPRLSGTSIVGLWMGRPVSAEGTPGAPGSGLSLATISATLGL